MLYCRCAKSGFASSCSFKPSVCMERIVLLGVTLSFVGPQLISVWIYCSLVTWCLNEQTQALRNSILLCGSATQIPFLIY